MSEDLKIVVCHHKEAELLQQYRNHPNRYVHVHGGRALRKSSSISATDFFGGMVGDDSGDNISARNPEVNEFTALYWVWKHYDEIGNPKKIGLNQYRRAFTEEDILQSESKDLCVYEDILPILGKKSIVDQFLMWHSGDILKTLFTALKELDGDCDNIEDGFYTCKFHPKNMFIASKDVFFEYMKFMSKYLDLCMQIFKVNDTMSSVQERTSGFVLERISSIFFDRKMKQVSSCTFTIPRSYI